MTAFALECAVESDVGGRANNEDTAFATGRLAVVADGVGGAAAGEIASRTVVNSLISLDKSRLGRPLDDALREAVSWGNQTVGFIAECRPQFSGMSTTLTAVVLTNGGGYLVVNVGDSRTYLVRGDRLRQLTRDDSLVQALIDRGAISAAGARRHPQRSIVLAALDGRPQPDLDLTRLDAMGGDRLLLCSDGLSDVVDDQAIAATLRIPSRRECARSLIELALANGGRDNISVIVADVLPRDDPAAGWLPARGPGG